MPPPSKPAVPKAAEPRFGSSFDPWNSSSTGHQRAENRLGASTGWRDSRNAKLASQFRGGAAGGERVFDQVGVGSRDYDPQLKALVKPEVHARAHTSVIDMLVKPGSMKESMVTSASEAAGPVETGEVKGGGARLDSMMTQEESLMEKRRIKDEQKESERGQPRKLFEGVVVYVNGSTHPLISDHKFKHVLAENGGKMSMHLGRKQVTHVIVGRPAGRGAGAGGGLAGGKLQKEIQKVGGCGMKFVGVEWVLESLKAGKRLPEARFSNLKIASKGQQSVYGLYSKLSTTATSDDGPSPSAQKF